MVGILCRVEVLRGLRGRIERLWKMRRVECTVSRACATRRGGSVHGEGKSEGECFKTEGQYNTFLNTLCTKCIIMNFIWCLSYSHYSDHFLLGQ